MKKKSKRLQSVNCQAVPSVQVTFDFKKLERRYSELTSREKEIFRLIVCGKMNKEIVDFLGISIVTVKLHRGRLMKKMVADNFAQLVQIAVALGLLGVVVETTKYYQYSSPQGPALLQAPQPSLWVGVGTVESSIIESQQQVNLVLA